MPPPKKVRVHKSLSLFDCSSESIEEDLLRQGFTRIAGVDEVGRGPLAGPVVAAACILPHISNLSEKAAKFQDKLTDSKLLSEQEREAIFDELTSLQGVQWSVSCVGPDLIDTINIRQATLLAMKEAVLSLTPELQFVLIDGIDAIDVAYPQRAVIKGDLFCRSISAASIIAKVTRDRIMVQLAKQYPEYGFECHKGYGTKEHLMAIKKYGITLPHRKSFSPIKEIIKVAG